MLTGLTKETKRQQQEQTGAAAIDFTIPTSSGEQSLMYTGGKHGTKRHVLVLV